MDRTNTQIITSASSVASSLGDTISSSGAMMVFGRGIWRRVGTLLLLLYASMMATQGGVILPDTAEETEYCQWESFNATCGENEVILMRSAHYGRMRLGRCLKEDYFVGCSADVLTHVDTRCSGRKSCVIRVPDPDLFNVQPCRKDLVAHFSAKYECVPVITGEPSQCGATTSHHRRHKLPPSGFISNYVTEMSGMGATHCPWRITVALGQQINFTLFDFFTWSEDNYYLEHPGSDACTRVGTIREKGREKEIKTCHQFHRVANIFSSTSDTVEVELVHPTSMNKKVYILLKYEAIGCANLHPPANSFMTRNADIAMVRCNQTSRTWHLVCKGTIWMGDIGNCSTGPDDKWKLGQVLEVSGRFPYGILIAIGIGVVLGIVLGVTFLLVVLACHKRRRRRVQKTRETNALLREDGGIYGEQGEVAYKLMEIRDTSHGPSTNLHLRGITEAEPCCPMVAGVQTLRRAQHPGGLHHRGDHVYESPHAQQQQGGPGGEMTLSGDMTLTLKVKDRHKAANNGGGVVGGGGSALIGVGGYPECLQQGQKPLAALTTVDLIQQEPKTATLKKLCNPRDLSSLESPPGSLVK